MEGATGSSFAVYRNHDGVQADLLNIIRESGRRHLDIVTRLNTLHLECLRSHRFCGACETHFHSSGSCSSSQQSVSYPRVTRLQSWLLWFPSPDPVRHRHPRPAPSRDPWEIWRERPRIASNGMAKDQGRLRSTIIPVIRPRHPYRRRPERGWPYAPSTRSPIRCGSTSSQPR